MTEQELRRTQHGGGGRDPLRRMFQVLDWMARQTGSHHGVREIAHALCMQPSTVSRLLSQMAELGVVQRHADTGQYSLGLELVRLGALAAAKLDLPTVARPHLVELTKESGENSYVSVYDPDRRQMMRIDTVPSPNPLRYVVAMNQWIDVVRGASGQGILAFLPESEIRLILSEAGLSRERQRSLMKELERVRARGYACTRGQRTPGAVGVASPIFDSRLRVVGDVFLTIPESRFDPSQQTSLGQLVRRAGERITEGLGGPATYEESMAARAKAGLP